MTQYATTTRETRNKKERRGYEMAVTTRPAVEAGRMTEQRDVDVAAWIMRLRREADEARALMDAYTAIGGVARPVVRAVPPLSGGAGYLPPARPREQTCAVCRRTGASRGDANDH
ncbi:hypothetical protein [Burkholderia dolosa]|uniref:hypothetical protein n=1 Tax=Burkholderia dolosa TaxID=152500 RepID=UPI001B90FEE1|nr:hypothetical protein [Burkholderia dolosa]MBR8058245.1 hypothetical protein [Burkholderia dolosa]MBY4829492.1 hypothetical protein [Burkholderia dolosa]